MAPVMPPPSPVRHGRRRGQLPRSRHDRPAAQLLVARPTLGRLPRAPLRGRRRGRGGARRLCEGRRRRRRGSSVSAARPFGPHGVARPAGGVSALLGLLRAADAPPGPEAASSALHRGHQLRGATPHVAAAGLLEVEVGSPLPPCSVLCPCSSNMSTQRVKPHAPFCSTVIQFTDTVGKRQAEKKGHRTNEKHQNPNPKGTPRNTKRQEITHTTVVNRTQKRGRSEITLEGGKSGGDTRTVAMVCARQRPVARVGLGEQSRTFDVRGSEIVSRWTGS